MDLLFSASVCSYKMSLATPHGRSAHQTNRKIENRGTIPGSVCCFSSELRRCEVNMFPAAAMSTTLTSNPGILRFTFHTKQLIIVSFATLLMPLV